MFTGGRIMQPAVGHAARRPKARRRLIYVAFLLGLTSTGSGTASAQWRPTAQEMAMLPPYCAARFNEKSPEFASWRGILGEDFIHVHHYCAGLNFLSRARRQVLSQERKDTLSAAVRDMDYVLSHARPEFSLRAEILTNRAVALSMLGRDGEAAADLETAIRLNPRFAEAYRTLADLQAKLNQKQKALETVTVGLQHVPNDRGLQRRYDELGGKKPYPTPVEATAPATVLERPASPKNMGAEAAAEGQPPAAKEAGDGVADRAVPAAAPTTQAKKTNPWCRFCPDEDAPPPPAPSTPPAGSTGPR
jgi:tetratricopeptide (TPR) repeat protein